MNIQENPYCPLQFLSDHDSNMLTGRERDIKDFMQALLSPKTKVMILHGTPGTGKSSFLHAGLVPQLKRLNAPLNRFDILDGNRILFCGSSPMEDIAHALYNSKWKEDIVDIKSSRENFIKKNIISYKFLIIKSLRYWMKKAHLFLFRKGLGYSDNSTWEKTSENVDSEGEFENFLKREEGLSDFFSFLSFYSFRTKILIIDHVEQIFTSSGKEDNKDIKSFFAGVKYFSKQDSDAKIILSVRTEFLYPLRVEIYDPRFAENVKDFFIENIEDEEKIIDVITHPCDKYKYSFDSDDVVNSIADLLRSTRRSRQRKDPKNISPLIILHIICYFTFENMKKRIKNGDKRRNILLDDVYGGSAIYMQVVSLFVENEIMKIEKILKNTIDIKYEEDNHDCIYDILTRLVEADSRCRKLVSEEEFRKNLSDKEKKLTSILYEEGIIICQKNKANYLTLSHDIFAEAVVFLRTGLLNVFENKRDPGIEDAMKGVLDEFKNEFKKNTSEKLRIASVVGKQFFHEKNIKLYGGMNDLLEILKKEIDSTDGPFIRVLIAQPFSALFLCRAESELDLEKTEFSQGEPNDNVWKLMQTKDRIFIDSSITIARLSLWTKLYKNIIDVRLSEFMPIAMLSYRNQSVFNPYTFSADKKENKKEKWCGALPTYHHIIKESYKNELENHFDYLWQKGITISDFLRDLQETKCDDKHIKYKKGFLDKINEEMQTAKRLSHEFI